MTAQNWGLAVRYPARAVMNDSSNQVGWWFTGVVSSSPSADPCFVNCDTNIVSYYLGASHM